MQVQRQQHDSSEPHCRRPAQLAKTSTLVITMNRQHRTCPALPISFWGQAHGLPSPFPSTLQ